MELQRFTRLGRVTRDLSAATDLDTVTDIITRLVGDAVSASVTMLALRDGDDLVTLGLRGTPLVPELAAGRFPLSEPVPICDAILTGQPVLLLDNEELSAAYPNLAGSDTVAMLAFPLRSGEDQAFGALALRFDALVFNINRIGFYWRLWWLRGRRWSAKRQRAAKYSSQKHSCGHT